MRGRNRPRAQRVPVATEEPLLRGDAYDYADAFEIRVLGQDPSTAEEWTRRALEEAPRLIRWTILIAHRYVLRFRLGPLSSPDHVLGWKVVTSQPEVVHIESVSPILRAAIIGRATSATTRAATTYLFYKRPVLGRMIFTVVGPIHRRISPYLLERAAATVGRTTSVSTGSAGDLIEN